ncbi:MAG TPA: hypothetical protein VI056_07275 [Candidatus Limnocylindria bacterium]
MNTAPLPLDQRDLVRRLRDMLAAVSFTGEGTGEALGSGDEIVSRSSGIPVQIRQLATHGTFGALVRLLILDLDVPIAHARGRGRLISARIVM